MSTRGVYVKGVCKSQGVAWRLLQLLEEAHRETAITNARSTAPILALVSDFPSRTRPIQRPGLAAKRQGRTAKRRWSRAPLPGSDFNTLPQSPAWEETSDMQPSVPRDNVVRDEEGIEQKRVAALSEEKAATEAWRLGSEKTTLSR